MHFGRDRAAPERKRAKAGRAAECFVFENAYGSVIAVSAAILPEYGGSNLGVPVAKVRALLEDAGLR